MTDDLKERLPLRAEVWFRDATKEWVLEISGEVNDTSLTCRHTQPAKTPIEDVAGLPSLYARIEALEAENERLREGMVNLSNILAGMAHELRAQPSRNRAMDSPKPPVGEE